MAFSQVSPVAAKPDPLLFMRVDLSDSPDPFAARLPVAGFTTGKGTAIAAPSRAALERAARMFQDIGDDADLGLVEDGPILQGNKRRRIEEDRQNDEDDCRTDPAPDFTMSQSTGFLNGRGQAVPPPSKAALQKAMDLMKAVEEEEHPETLLDPVPAPPRPTSGFTTGSGTAVAEPSSAFKARVSQLFADADNVMAEPFHSTGFMTPVKSTMPITDDARRQAMAIFGEDDVNTTRPSTSMLPPVVSTSFRPLMVPASPFRPPPTTTGPTPFRTPLRPTTNTFSQATNSPVPTAPGSQRPKPIEIKTPIITPRRVGMGLTPISRAKTKKTFITPFKSGTRTPGSPLRSHTAPRTSLLPSPSLQQGAKTPPLISKPVFDLTSKPRVGGLAEATPD